MTAPPVGSTVMSLHDVARGEPGQPNPIFWTADWRSRLVSYDYQKKAERDLCRAAPASAQPESSLAGPISPKERPVRTMRLATAAPLALSMLLFWLPETDAQQTPVGTDIGTLYPEEAAPLYKAPGYSPYAGRNYPTRVLWGDTHLHTANSLDAAAFGNSLGPEPAYRFARARRWSLLPARRSG
jgi:hypothetical protein